MKYRRRKRFWGRILATIMLLIFFIPFGIYGYRILMIEKNEGALPIIDTPSTSSTSVASTPATGPNTPAQTTIPEKFSINVLFTSQAPLGVWDPLHDDACEEASLLMVKHFKEGTKIDSPESFDAEIKDLVAYEESKGYGLSITLEELASIAKAKYGMKGTVKTNITITDLKREIAKGNPVIVGAAGKLLKNPNFRGEGPNYHMLVIKGYDTKNFITNDPGTRKGNSYVYSQDLLYDAIHNWDEGNIINGPKSLLVFE